MTKLDLKPFKSQTDKILAWMPDWLSQDDFDAKVEKARLFTTMEEGPVECFAYTDNTPLMPSWVGNPAGSWGDSLYLLQCMVQNGVVEAKKMKGKVYYRKRKQEKA